MEALKWLIVFTRGKRSKHDEAAAAVVLPDCCRVRTKTTQREKKRRQREEHNKADVTFLFFFPRGSNFFLSLTHLILKVTMCKIMIYVFILF